ncbi:MAG: S8 family serine peptidase [Planctomycetota bacterium]
MSTTLRCRSAIFVSLLTACAGSVWAIETTSRGLDIADIINANPLYEMGLTGSTASIINVEAGLASTSHAALQHVSGSYFGSGGLSSTSSHATAVAFAMAGRGSTVGTRGIAYNAALYSGSIANSISGNSFTLTSATLRDGLASPLVQRNFDVVNMSWGNSSGSTWLNHAIDASARRTNTTMVVSSGNNGYRTNSVGSPARAFNSITVGALASELNGYSSTASFSSGGPVVLTNPNNSGQSLGVYAAVDIVAPGQDLTLASSSNNAYSGNWRGTSFAAPVVAGGASLLVDAGRQLVGGRSTDPRVIKAAMLNSARKNSGWNNGQALTGGVVRTTQALDYATGAGILDVANAYNQLTQGQTDLSAATAAIESVGWDFNSVNEFATIDYRFGGLLDAGETITATLTWFSEANWSVYDNWNTFSTSAGTLQNLDLSVWSVDELGNADELIAESVSPVGSTEHLSFDIAEAGEYLLRVENAGVVYDLIGSNGRTDFALAWQTGELFDQPVPTPGGMVLCSIAALVALRRRR